MTLIIRWTFPGNTEEGAKIALGRHSKHSSDDVKLSSRTTNKREWDVHKYRERTYGLTRKDAFKLWLDQDCSCGVCRTNMRFEDLHVDHDHTTGRVRGLLCPNCNRGLGYFGDMEDGFSQAIAYMERTK